MPRTKRHWVSQQCGSFHIISRLADSNTRFNIEEKDHFLSLMERLASGFFIRIHAFCIMGRLGARQKIIISVLDARQFFPISLFSNRNRIKQAGIIPPVSALDIYN